MTNALRKSTGKNAIKISTLTRRTVQMHYQNAIYVFIIFLLLMRGDRNDKCAT